MFTSYPTSGESLYDQLIYSYESSQKSDLELTITNSANITDTYVKKLYDVTSASINVAPLFRYSAIPKLSVKSDGIYPSSDGYAAVVVSCGGYSTTKRIFTLAKHTISINNIITSMSLDRLIGVDESEIIRIYTPENESVTAQLYGTNSEGEEGELITEYSIIDNHDGMLELVFKCPDVEYDQLTLNIYYTDTTHSLNYTVTKPYHIGESVRLAWLSSAGSIEHHTFPIVKGKSMNSDGSYSYTLLSAYAPDSYVEAIAEIVSSAAVWIVEDDEYRKVEVESDMAPIKDCGSLSYLELKIKDNG